MMHFRRHSFVTVIVTSLLVCSFGLSSALRSNGSKQDGDQSIVVNAKFAASNMINVTVETPLLDKTKVTAYFHLDDGKSKLDFRSVSHHSNDQLSTTVLRYSLWLAKESFSHNVTLETHVLWQTNPSSLKSVVKVTRASDMRPPRIARLLWHNATWRRGVPLCSRLHCSTPPKPIYVIEGDDVSISCVIDPVTTTRPVTIQWLRNGVVHHNVTYTKTDDVIDKLEVRSDKNSVYQCKASTPHGVSLSHEITVYRIDFNSPTVADQDYTRTVGSSVKMYCNVTAVTSHAPRGSVYVSWQKDGAEIAPNPRMIAVHDDTLIVSEITEADAGKYRCTVHNDELGYDKPLNTAMLRVRGASSNGQDVRELYGQDNYIETFVGEAISLFCVFSTSELVDWTMPKDIGAHDFGPFKTALHVFDATSALDQQTIKCETTSRSATKTFLISVKERPVIVNSDNTLSANVGGRVQLNCDVNMMVEEVTWYFNNEQLPVIGPSLVWNNINKENNGEVMCHVTAPGGVAIAATSIFVYDRTEIVHGVAEPGDDRVFLHCLAETDSNTALNITWFATNLKTGTMETLDDPTGKEIRLANDTLSVSVHLLHGYNFTCNASNGYSQATHTFHDLAQYVPAKEARTGSSMQSKSSWEDVKPLMLVVTVSSAVVCLAIILGVSTFKCFKEYRKSKNSQSDSRSLRTNSRLNSYLEETAQDHLLGTLMAQSNPRPVHDVNCNSQKIRKSSCLANDPDLMTLVLEVSVDRSRIVVQDMIGKGQFGRVFKGILLDQKGLNCGTVAIKTLKYKSDETDMVDLFLREAIIMKNFKHQNVLSLLAISVDSDGSPMVVLPYMSRGDLRGYILNDSMEITVLDLLKLGLQVARGMAYLCSQKFVHRDLACRNCMVDDNNCVKVADFGLSRDLFSRDYYRDSPGKHPLPVRWMAPECHKRNVFTMQSDVWSFGVLLWELMTRGLTPYYEVENWQVPGHVMSGVSLAQPEYCPDSVFEVMVGCWYVEPQARSAFPEIVQQIEDIILTARTGTTYDSDRFYHNIERPEETDYRDTDSIPTTPV